MAYKDDCIIYIPTLGRIDKQLTLQRLPDAAGAKKDRVWLVAPKSEAKKLERKWEVPVLTQPDTVVNIAQKRAWIIEQCRHERLIMLDDDLRFCYRDSWSSPSMLTCATDHEGANFHWKRLEYFLTKYAHAGLTARMGAQEKRHAWHFNSRMMYVLGYQTKILQKECELGRIRTREDMDYTLQLFRKGYRNLVNFRLVVDQYFDKPGGMRNERTIEQSDKDALKLAKWFPKYVRVVEKNYKQSIPRKEVQVDWKKAYNKGASSREEYLLTKKLLTKWGLLDNRTRRLILDKE